jgi:enamine deaminase RidA (YjgF/YER057c/UK114 family)
MARRTSIYIDGFEHTNPIPTACRIGNLLMSGIVVGKDPATGRVAPGLDEQCALVFSHMRAIVEAGGGTTDDIVKVTVWLSDRSQRAAVNREWLEMFPDPADRPARQAMQADLTGGILMQCDFVAVIGEGEP